MSAIAYLQIKKPILYVEKFKSTKTYLVQIDGDVYTMCTAEKPFRIAIS